MNPSLFRSRRVIEALSIAAVGTALAAATGGVFRVIFGNGSMLVTAATAMSTLLLGSLWAALLRRKETLGSTGIRVGWLLSLPLAITNAALSAGVLLAFDHGSSPSLAGFLSGLLMGATFGVMFWLPGLILTLLFFGVPVAWGQRLAQKGLAGQERGDGVVGGVSALIALGAGASAFAGSHGDRAASWFLVALSAVGAALGAGVMGAAWWRDRLRRAFVADVEAGKVERYRVDTTEEGKVLVRVVHQGEGYRVADFAEEVAALDDTGAVTRGARRDA